MKTLFANLVILFFSGVAAVAQDPQTFALREMDMHLHAGMERPLPLDQWIDLAIKDGRKALFLLDHLELYAQTPDELERWRKKDGLPPWYPVGAEGHQKLMADFGAYAAAHPELLIIKGWEIAEFDLDDGLDREPMTLAEVIGWHISPNHDDGPPDGKRLIHRIHQILKVQKEFPVPMIIFHPFPVRIEALEKAAKRTGNDPNALTTQECRFFTAEEQKEVIRLIKDESLYIEMGLDTIRYWDRPALREALIADIKPLADAGVKFTVSTDNHYLAHARTSFHPEVYCEPCGITPENANALVREVLRRRTK